MPVAISAGMCLRNLRLTSGLEPPLPIPYIVLGGVRDTDPLEQELIDRSEVERISVDDIRKRSEKIHAQMERLSSLVDLIYIHIDMDVLDPREVPGHPLTVADGPTSEELGSALREMFRYEKAAALGIASTPYAERDKDGLSRQAAYNLIRGAIEGVSARRSGGS
jgi:arginase family enzyme